MCGRFALTSPAAAIRQLVDFSNQPNFPPRYNIAPSQAVHILRATPSVEMVMVQWGLVPPWVKPEQLRESANRPQINARGETVMQKPSFENAFKRRRCLIPADGFYEWDRKTGQPYLIRRRDRQVFFIGGLWEIWSGADGSEIESCAIITVPANDTLAHFHHRMPTIVPPTQADEWLHCPETRAASLSPMLTPAPSALFEALPISKRVNKVAEDDEDLWREERVTVPASQLDLF
jgi:putative SOS response-associated peptidase YedK